ncbi:anhydro-N-acetylmuramic acid kinase [Marinoscillum sp. MHG1-6]|uniref:anhydro-N-acetylmuramic acid kinase n=1 Tax=Marinoscillum sp. MHG1-6 TaxID=2959627 RepID=UPI0021580CEE|nr:anhydro-N-acetylmuramic acid kinase [Marinoscillum sp. MHG1-6]
MKIVGIMSGSSLDGLDLCLTDFWQDGVHWKFEIQKAETASIPGDLESRLKNAPTLAPDELETLDTDYGNWIGEQVSLFVKGEADIAAVAVHGHTVFHEPENNISVQLGRGQCIADQCGLTVIDTFRIEDIRKGGQGAPLVPVGEHYLFHEYQGLVNLGGIANITIQLDGLSRAWDLCPCNQVLNYFSEKLGFGYDRGGLLARSGSQLIKWKEQLNQLPYFHQEPPKSLSNQWGRTHVMVGAEGDPKALLHTYCHFIADTISENVHKNLEAGAKIIFTGGGALNDYLMELIRERLDGDYQIGVPDEVLVSFKEALIFGFLGLLRLKEQPNVFASVTGATEDTCAGTVNIPSKNR